MATAMSGPADKETEMTNSAVATDDPVAEAQAITQTFDPNRYVRKLKGRGGGEKDYLDVAWRVLWFRKENPDGHIETELVELSSDRAVFKARVTKSRAIDTGSGEIHEPGVSTGYGSETAGDFPDFIEKAETKALGRALNSLGYGVQFAELDESIDSHPVERKPTPIRQPAEPTFGDRIKEAVKANKKEIWTKLFDAAGSDRGKWAQIIAQAPSPAYLEGIANVLAERDLVNDALTHGMKSREKALTRS
jgi:hypothetical protein